LSGKTHPGRRPAAPIGRGEERTAPAAPAAPAALAALDEAAPKTAVAATIGGPLHILHLPGWQGRVGLHGVSRRL